MSIGPLNITDVFGGGRSQLPTTPPTDEIGSTNMWSVNVPGWYSYVSDSLEKSPELQWPQSIQTYSDMRHDAQIQGLFLATTLPIRRYHWLIDPNGCDPKQVENLARDLTLQVKDHEPEPRKRYRQRFDFGAHLRDALVSIIMGHYGFEQVGEIGDDGQWHLTKLAPRPPETITEITVDAQGALTGFKQLFSSQMIPENRVTWYAYQMEGANWTGRSLLRACYRNWLRKDRLLRVDAQKQERNGIGIPIAESPPGMSGAAMLRLDMLMRKLRAGDTAGGAVPNGTKVSLVGTTGTLPDTIASVRLDNEEMARAWLAMFMQLGQTQTGSRALGTEFIDFFSDSLDELANWICATFTASAIENWWDWNVDPDADSTPQLMYTRNPDSAFTGREFAMLLERGAIVMDEQLENAIRERYGLPMRTPGLPQPQVPQPGTSVTWPPSGATGVVTPPSTSPAGEGPMSDFPVYGSGDGRKAKRAVSAQSTSPSPVTLPDRPLRRELFAHELRAAVDWGSADANWQQQRDLLVSAVRKPQLQQIDELHDQLVEAGNSLAKIGAIQAPPLLENLIFTHMSTMASLGAHDAQHEAQRQGVTLQLPDLNQLSEDQRERAKVVDQFLADTLTSSAKSSAFIYAGGSLTGKEIADKVKEDLINLSPSFLSDQLGGALTAAMNAGRKATIGLAMSRPVGAKVMASKGQRIAAQDDGNGGATTVSVTLYASELLDQNTCDPCAAIDGTSYMTMDDAESDYPSGGYSDCDGWARCRGTLVAVYDEVPAVPTPEPGLPFVTPGAEVPSGGEAVRSWVDTISGIPKTSDVIHSQISGNFERLRDAYQSVAPSEVQIRGSIGEFSNLDEKQVTDIGNALADVTKKHPDLVTGDRPLTEVTFMSSPKLPGRAFSEREIEFQQGGVDGVKALTYRSEKGYGIMFNDLNAPIEDLVREYGTEGPTLTTYDTIVHETGHAWFASHGVGDLTTGEMARAGLNFSDFEKISDYAASSTDEGLAEAWSAKYGSSGMWDNLSADFRNNFDSLIKSAAENTGGGLPDILKPGKPAEYKHEWISFGEAQEEAKTIKPELPFSDIVKDQDFDNVRTIQRVRMTPDQVTEWMKYTETDWQKYNDPLRGIGPNVNKNGIIKKAAQRKIDILESAFESAGRITSQNEVVYRAISGTAYNGQVGEVIREPAFLSTGLGEKNLSETFGWVGQVHEQANPPIKINVPKGVRFLQGGRHFDISEIMFEPGTRLRIDAVDRNGYPTEMTMLKG